MRLEFRALTPGRWVDLEALFGPRGACGGCWCMWWRRPRAESERQKGPGNKRAFRRIVASGAVPGVLAYDDGRPVGWCAVERRETYAVLERSRVLKRIDAQPVWSVPCFFVSRQYRGKGVSVALLKAAVAHAQKRGARLVEGYPVEPRKDRLPDAFAWTGTVAAFREAGFREAARGSPSRPIMRYEYS